MRLPLLSRRLAVIACLLLMGITLLLVLALPAQVVPQVASAYIIYTLALMLLFALACTGLILVWNAPFRKWWGWGGVLGTLTLGMALLHSEALAGHEHLIILAYLLLVACMLNLGVALAIYFFYNDHGLGWFAGWFAFAVWALLIAWRVQGNLVKIMFVSAGSSDPFPLWWLSPFICLTWWLLPLSALSYAGYTLRLLFREISTRDG